MQWNHFVPEFDEWFNNTYVKMWGEKNDMEVIVENVGMTSLHSRAESEISAQKGHDLCIFLRPPPIYEDHVIDHREIYEECEHKYGRAIDLAKKVLIILRQKSILAFRIAMSRIPLIIAWIFGMIWECTPIIKININYCRSMDYDKFTELKCIPLILNM